MDKVIEMRRTKCLKTLTKEKDQISILSTNRELVKILTLL